MYLKSQTHGNPKKVKAQIASKVAIKRRVTPPSKHAMLSGAPYPSATLLKPEFSVELRSGETSHPQVASAYGHYADVKQVQSSPNVGIISPSRGDYRLEAYGAPGSSLSIHTYQKGLGKSNGTRSTYSGGE